MEEEKIIEGLAADTSPTAETAVPPLHEERAREENTDMPPAEISADGNFFAPTSRANQRSVCERSAEPQSERTPEPATDKQAAVGDAPRDWAAEWAELAKEHPEVIGKTLPNDIYEACLNSDRTPLRVYESMMLEKLGAEVSRLQKENDTLRQNAENAMRAPVTGVAGSGVNTAPEDEILRGFNNFLRV